MEYSKRLESLKSRRADLGLLRESVALDQYFSRSTESYEKLKMPDEVRYVIGAMAEVDDVYTKNSYKEGDRVKKHLGELMDNGFEVEFRYQGSVTNNTHIKAHSDIDLLVITKKYFSLEPPLKPSFPYNGNPENDMKELRNECFRILDSRFTEVVIDNSGAKSISLSGGSLKRKVDVVPSNWYDTLKYRTEGEEYLRGIHIFDKDKNKRIANFPFLHNYLLDMKDIACTGNYKKLVRLSKTMKADSDRKIDISSYDMAAILYHMPNDQYSYLYTDLEMLPKVRNYLMSCLSDWATFSSRLVPDSTRKIVDNVNEDSVMNLLLDYNELINDIQKNVAKKLEEIKYLY